MAILDDNNDTCVVRIVYDGPPFSGKTTTLRALSEHLCKPMESPEEHDGRTLYFDWLDYTAGRFEGRPIRCQVVSVPGQRSLFARRKALLREADAVVFVADTGSIGIDLSLKYAQELGGILAGLDEPRPGVIIGANKRDVEDAIPVVDVVEKFRAVGLDGALIETTAITNLGVHESFLFGVRLALDRVRELSQRGLLVTGSPTIDSCGDLLKQLTEADSGPSASALSPAGASAVKESPKGPQEMRVANNTRSENNRFPDPFVSSGLIWPPIEGRVILQQAIATGKPVSRKLQSGNFYATSKSGWKIHSRKLDWFPDQKVGRSALTEWARVHVLNRDFVSARRCVVLSPDANGWRLWQVVKDERSIDAFLSDGKCETEIRRSVEHLLVACRKVLQAAQAFRNATVTLSVSTSKVGTDSTEPKYIGLMPGFNVKSRNGVNARVDELSIAEKCLGKHIRFLGTHFSSKLVLAELDAIRTSSPVNEPITNILGKILTKSEVTS